MSAIEKIREHCLKKENVREELPFDEYTPVYKIYGKIFLLANILQPCSINVKCDPEYALELREQFSAILPGYHMNKKHWNTIMLDGTLRPVFIFELVDHSFDLVLASIPQRKRISG